MIRQLIRRPTAHRQLRTRADRAARELAPWDELLEEDDWDDLAILFYGRPGLGRWSSRTSRAR